MQHVDSEPAGRPAAGRLPAPRLFPHGRASWGGWRWRWHEAEEPPARRTTWLRSASSRPRSPRGPAGAFCSPLRPAQRHGHIDDHGQRRHNDRPQPRGAAWTAAAAGSWVASSRSFANETIRILLDVATPIHIMAPMSAGHSRWFRWRREQHDAGEGGGQAVMHDKRVQPRLEVTTISR